ncbi:PadR family transcriptional regulator [Nocardiopsis gilva YIM 90087]|uniref:PadR family transcriptional regulator n=1 Tax=Nocardiopsis gilva YIM 90087 TaxID=1235441 RepID=A0A223S3T4_9ACTN|nr:PadR family transcriptional regulator [Nocardiopsis gilva]ASU82771.1 PadR family transcriptional regulator [Nocardiopsis gilva YIM 90087]
MSTIFGHGRLRLYLLKLLDESPRHGYEIISLLRDRFLGVYSPSPGTIYPRLARLEEEGLVTHEEVNGRKVYRLTDKGREELRSRSTDLDDLERELTESVRDVARAVKEDVRDTISSLREELKFAAGGGRRSARTEREERDEREEEERASATTSSDDTKESEDRDDRTGRDGNWWERDWQKFAENIGSWGSGWGKQGRQGEPLEFEQALHDFSDRVRDVVREAGHVGESAAQDLRRILDDTIEVIRRDVSSWGPPGSRCEHEKEEEARDTTSATDTTTSEPEETPKASSDAQGDGSKQSSSPPSGDPWSTAVAEEEPPQNTNGDKPKG